MRNLSLAVATTLVAFLSVGSLSAQDAENGKLVFKGNCTACHTTGPKEDKLVGPGLLKVAERWAGKEDLLKTWIQNPKAAYETGDAYVKELWGYDASEMTPQAVSEEEIADVLAYLADPAAIDGAAAEPVEEEAAEGGEEEGSSLWIWLVIVGVIFLIIALSGRGVKEQLQHAIAESEGKEFEEESFSTRAKKWAGNNKVIVAIIGIFLILGGVVDGYKGLMAIDVEGGYHPAQPIAFPHDVHTAEDKDAIACQYCHNSVEKSKHAGIPTTNVCMNCHFYISEGRTTGKTEIAKIYEAINFDPETKSYGSQHPDSVNPIAWVKVHNLPDHVYFNHSQHVKVGQLECEECHGDVTQMKTVEQVAPLTMGWCIDCHGKTEVQGIPTKPTLTDDDNVEDYNQYYVEYHSRMDKTTLQKVLEDDVVTVEEIGGWECAKCHY